MALSPLLPISAAAIAPLAVQTLERITDRLSFAELLGRWGRAEGAPQAEQTAPSDVEAGLQNTAAASRGQAARLEGAHREAQQAAEEFQRVLAHRLAERGIDASLSMQLESDGRGGVIVSGEHPQRIAIEKTLAEHPELVQAFHQLLAKYQLVQRLEATGSASLSDDRLSGVRVLLSGEEVTAEFD